MRRAANRRIEGQEEEEDTNEHLNDSGVIILDGEECEGAELNNFLMYFMFSVSTVVHIHYVHVGSMSVVG